MDETTREQNLNQGRAPVMESGAPLAEAPRALQPYGGIRPYIFVSYAHRDDRRAMGIIELLFSESYRIWYDEGIEPGSDWDEYIASRIEGCEYFLALLSDAFLDSPNCRDELNYARDLNKQSILLYLDDIELPGGMRMRLGRSQAIYISQFREIHALMDKLRCVDGLDVCGSRTDGDAGAAAAETAKTAVKAHRRWHTLPAIERVKWQRNVCFVSALVMAGLLLRGRIQGTESSRTVSLQKEMQNLRTESTGNGVLLLAAESPEAAYMPVERGNEIPSLYRLEAGTEYHFSNFSKFYDELVFSYTIDEGNQITLAVNDEIYQIAGAQDAQVTLYADPEDSFFLVDSNSGLLPIKAYNYQKEKLVLASEPVGGFQKCRFETADDESFFFLSEPLSMEDTLSFRGLTGGPFQFEERYYVNRTEHAIYRKSNYGEIVGELYCTYAGKSVLQLSSESQELNDKGPKVKPGERVRLQRVYFDYEGVDASSGTKVYKILRENEEFGYFRESTDYPFVN